jgi:hypothetical protein
MEKEERKILEVRTDAGELLFSLRVIVKNEPDPKPHQDGKKAAEHEKQQGQKKGTNQDGNHQLMTDAQKRYLFRLLAGQGIEEDAAYEELKKVFGVDSLKKVTKLEASQEIERRLAVRKGGAVNGRV